MLGMIERWETIETISAALQVCLRVQHEHQPEHLRQLRGQLKYWRRAQSGENIAGWIELHIVKGSGPYLYHRRREPESRRIHTKYYGRADWLLNQGFTPVDILRI